MDPNDFSCLNKWSLLNMFWSALPALQTMFFCNTSANEAALAKHLVQTLRPQERNDSKLVCFVGITLALRCLLKFLLFEPSVATKLNLF